MVYFYILIINFNKSWTSAQPTKNSQVFNWNLGINSDWCDRLIYFRWLTQHQICMMDVRWKLWYPFNLPPRIMLKYVHIVYPYIHIKLQLSVTFVEKCFLGCLSRYINDQVKGIAIVIEDCIYQPRTRLLSGLYCIWSSMKVPLM